MKGFINRLITDELTNREFIAVTIVAFAIGALVTLIGE
jgi:VIT1/CCC1 family predicted Fe2+/Mn2+ transporter